MSSIEPFFFGPEGRLFGIYHAPVEQDNNHAVLLAGPLLEESMRAHHTLRQVALKLCAAGYHVMRFDYSGTGNSMGDLRSLDMDDWEQDVNHALQELLDVSGARKVSIVAVRAACILAARATRGHKVESLLMWDPIFTGEFWYRQLLAAPMTASDEGGDQGDGLVELSGFVVGIHFITVLRGSTGGEVAAAQSRAFVTDEQAYEHSPEEQPFEKVVVPHDCQWQSQTSEVLFPHEIVRSICEAMD